MTVKDVVEKVGRELSSDASMEEAIERIQMLFELEQALQEAREGKTCSHEEIVERLSKRPR